VRTHRFLLRCLHTIGRTSLTLEDITQVDWSQYCGSADVVVGGSPCQSFSVAGKRKGVDDERGGLMLDYLRAVNEIRPQWVVWENVPGVLSVDGGRAFGTFLGLLDELGYGWGYRVLDAQYFGVAQRRRRVFVVGHIGSDWRSAASVLFERTSLFGDTKPRRGQGKRAATGAEGGARGTGGAGAYAIAPNIVGRQNSNGGHHLGIGGDLSYTLDTTAPPSVCAFSAGQGAAARSLGLAEEQSPTLRASQSGTNMVPTVAVLGGTRGNGSISTDGLAGTLISGKDFPIVESHDTARRLTPVECERLQGFPDGHTDVPYKGKAAPDSLRYAALGNSMAVPVIRWIGEGIAAVEEYRKEQRWQDG